MKPDGKKQKIELVSGGMNVDGAFVPKIAPVNPAIKADTLVNPPVVPNLPPPKVAEIPQSAIGRANNVVNETQNIITAKTKEAEKRQELLDTLAASGDQQTLATLSQQKLDEYGVGDNLKELKDIQLQLTDMNTASDMTKTNIAGAAGQTLGQAQRELTQEDRENAVRSTGLAARAAVLQGNIETGRTLAKDAVDIAYQDRMLKNQNLITQLNEYGKIADEQTKQLVDQAKAEAEAEIKADDEMKANIADAIVNGASQQEIAALNKQLPPNATAEQIAQDRAQKNQLAQSVIGRGAGQMRNLNIQAQQASIANSYDQIRSRQADDALKALTAIDEATEGEEATTAKNQAGFAILDLTESLLTEEGMSGAVGLSLEKVGGAFSELGVLPGTKAADYTTGVNQLKDMLALPNLEKLKGAMSDKDIMFLRNIGTRLNTGMSEEAFKKELDNIKMTMNPLAKAHLQSLPVGATFVKAGQTYQKTGDDSFEPI
jgi:hypothetical protein